MLDREPSRCPGGIPDPFVVRESIGFLLAVNARLLQRAMTERLAEHGIMHAHWAIMLALWPGDGITQKVLSDRVAIEEPTLARALNRMEVEELVRRERDPGDGRQMRVFLTPRSSALRNELIPIAAAAQTRATRLLTEIEQDLLLVLLRKMLGSQKPDADNAT